MRLLDSVSPRAELEKDNIVVGEIYPSMTSTNLGKNSMGNLAGAGPRTKFVDPDPPEFVADLVLKAIDEGKAQYFANDRIRQMAGIAG